MCKTLKFNFIKKIICINRITWGHFNFRKTLYDTTNTKLKKIDLVTDQSQWGV